MGPACPYLPHVALTWPQRPGLGGLGGQGLPQLRGPPIPSSPLTPKAGQREGLTILGLGGLGEGCAIARLALAWDQRKRHLRAVAGPCRGIRRAKSTTRGSSDHP